MRIDGRHVILQAYVQKVSTRRTGAAEGSGAPAQEDAVTLSQWARDVERVKQHLASLPEVREERVAEIRARLASGDYHVADESLAESLLLSGVFGRPDEFPG